jgi:hypothetical protein
MAELLPQANVRLSLKPEEFRRLQGLDDAQLQELEKALRARIISWLSEANIAQVDDLSNAVLIDGPVIQTRPIEIRHDATGAPERTRLIED